MPKPPLILGPNLEVENGKERKGKERKEKPKKRLCPTFYTRKGKRCV